MLLSHLEKNLLSRSLATASRRRSVVVERNRYEKKKHCTHNMKEFSSILLVSFYSGWLLAAFYKWWRLTIAAGLTLSAGERAEARVITNNDRRWRPWGLFDASDKNSLATPQSFTASVRFNYEIAFAFWIDSIMTGQIKIKTSSLTGHQASITCWLALVPERVNY